jgi:hypothetical protein
MAQDDYIVDPGSGNVYFKGAVVATYDVEKKTVKEYQGDGANRKRWIARALKNAPDVNPDDAFDIKADNAFEIAIAIAEWEEDFYVHFPHAPRIPNNPVGYLHKEIYEWVKEKYPEVIEYLYPRGFWSELNAGMGANRTIRPEKEIEIEYLN